MRTPENVVYQDVEGDFYGNLRFRGNSVRASEACKLTSMRMKGIYLAPMDETWSGPIQVY
jgi:hypothetical protein